MLITRPRCRTVLLALALTPLLVVLPVEPMVAEEVAPATRSETVTGIEQHLPDVAEPEAGASSGPDAAAEEPSPGSEFRRSEPIVAPLPFVGLGVKGTGEEPVLLFRTMGRDGEWSTWAEAGMLEEFDGPDTDSSEARTATRGDTADWRTTAIWAGPSEQVQFKVGGEPDSIEVTFTDTAGLSETRLERLGRWLDSRRPARTAEANVLEQAPDIQTRSDWGADETWRSGTPTERDVSFSVLHHTATKSDYTREEAPAQVRNIYYWHTHGNGWNDIGYNFLVDRFGTIYEGRYGGIDKGIQGAHAAGWNAGSVGVALMANHNDVSPDARALDALSDLLAWKYRVHDLDPDPEARVQHNDESIRTLEGHRNLRGSYTEWSSSDSFQYDCPGQRLYWRMPDIRDAIADEHAALQAADPPYVPTRTERVVDTRSGLGLSEALGHREGQRVTVAGQGEVPGDAAAVAINVTAVRPSHDTFLTVWPSGQRRPRVASLNAAADSVVNNFVLAEVGADGTVAVYNRNGSTDVVFDVVGYVPAGSEYVAVTPERLLDSRDDVGGPPAILGQGETRSVPVDGAAGVPSGAAAVAINVTAVTPSSDTYLTVWPKGQRRPRISSLNIAQGRTGGNFVLAEVGDDDIVQVYNRNGEVDIVVDVVGYVPGDTEYTPVRPARLLDTRQELGGQGPLGPRSSVTLDVAGSAGVPTDARAVAVNVTAVGPTDHSYLTAWPAGTRRPRAATVNFPPERTVGNSVLLEVGDGGEVRLYNHNGEVDVVVDVVGYVTDS